MSLDELMAHAKKYSKSYQNDLSKGWKSSKWSIPEERPFMCTKTVTKLNLANNGILSVELKQAFEADQAEISETTTDRSTITLMERTEREQKLPRGY